MMENKMKIVSGDLLEASEEYICQQNNCVSSNAKGLAETMRRKLGVDPYSKRKVPDTPGTIKVWEARNKKVICMFAQYNPGKARNYTDGVLGADSIEQRLEWFKMCLFEIAQLKPASVAFPFNIGCGLAGGHWPDYLAAISHFSNYFNIPVTIYKI